MTNSYPSILREAAALYDIQAGAEFKPDSQDGEDVEAAKLATEFLRSTAKAKATHLRNLADGLEEAGKLLRNGTCEGIVLWHLEQLTTPLQESK